MKTISTINNFRIILLLGTLVTLIPLFTAAVMAGSGHGDKGMEGHGDMAMDKNGAGGAFKHHMTMDGVKAEFEIMDLKSMNMKDPNGATHHVMVKFYQADTGVQIKNVAGKIKVIGPSKNETVAALKDYGGIYAANFTFDEPGKYGVICLSKVEGKKPLYKFWYNHKM